MLAHHRSTTALTVDHNVLESLAAVSTLWRTPGPFRSNAITALAVSTGQDAALIASAIDRSFGVLDLPHLLKFVRANDLHFRSRDTHVLHIGPSNVFTAWLHGVVVTLLLGFETTLKPSSLEPAFALLFAESLRQRASFLASRFHVIPVSQIRWKDYAAVVAYGSDETLEKLSKQLKDHQIFIGYGSKQSIAVIPDETLAGAEFAGRWLEVRDDFKLYHLAGCLSPTTVFLGARLGQQWRHALDALKPGPRIVEFEKDEEILEAMTPYKGTVSCIGIAALPKRRKELENTLKSLKPSRLCALGDMQQPTLDWRNGGISLVEKLRNL